MTVQSKQSDALRIAIVGASFPGREMAKIARRSPELILTAVVDFDESLAQSVVDGTDARTLGSMEELGDGSIDVIYVATPTPMHHDHVLAAASLGAHVIVEKPMAVNLRQAAAMIEAVEAAGCQMFVGQTQSFEPGPRQLALLAESRELGKLIALHSTWITDWMGRPRRPIDLDADEGGGVVFRQGAHQFDVLRLVAGGLGRSVRAWCQPIEGATGSAAFVAEIDFEGGVMATAIYDGRAGTGAVLEGLDLHDSEDSDTSSSVRSIPSVDPCDVLVAVFEDGMAVADSSGLTVSKNGRRRFDSFPGVPRGWDAVVDEVVGVLRRGESPRHNGVWGQATLEVCEAVRHSDRAGGARQLHLQVTMSSG